MMLILNITEAESALKTYCKSKGYENPIYRIESKNSAILDGDIYRYKHYRISVTVNGIRLATGDGMSKRIARKKAAMIGTQQLRLIELQTFWQFYQTAMTGGGRGGDIYGRFQPIQSSTPMPIGLIQAASVNGQCQIEELISSDISFGQPPQQPKQMENLTNVISPTPLDNDQTNNDKTTTARSRANSDMSMMLNYAVEKLKDYKMQDEMKELESARYETKTLKTTTTIRTFQSNYDEDEKKKDEKDDKEDDDYFVKKQDELEELEQQHHIHQAKEDFQDMVELVMAIAGNDNDN